MTEPNLAQPRTQKPERPTPVCCPQCGETLDPVFVQTFTLRAGKLLCRDCAFDQLPCTD